MDFPGHPDVTVHRFGREAEPVVTIDRFSGLLPELLRRGRAAQYRPGGAAYPGIRGPAVPDYLDGRRDLLLSILHGVFGLRQRVELESSMFSIVAKPPAALAPMQRLPHFDHAGPGIIAAMHYLLGPATGGTAFYRHRRTGFETIDAAREPLYREAQILDEREYGAPPEGYHYGDSDRYEMIGEIEAQPDRFAIYRGYMLHSGVVTDAENLSPDPRTGRLTVNMFLRGA